MDSETASSITVKILNTKNDYITAFYSSRGKLGQLNTGSFIQLSAEGNA
jgi:hypothetical protein